MRSIDFAPLTRSTIGFDRLFDLLQTAAQPTEADGGYPPYNIARTGENGYRLELAVAGFSPEQLSITAQQGQLIVAGRKSSGNGSAYLYQGIPGGSFERRFQLADFLKVTGASFADGILAIDLVREVPEAMKPRKIAIGGAQARA
jgi:molecular chaperone IbpA